MKKRPRDAAEVAWLMRSITTALRNHCLVDTGDLRHNDRENMIPLIDLLESHLPDEECIEAYYKAIGGAPPEQEE